jgi:putative ribosome biogenesis GTPase RsgA
MQTLKEAYKGTPIVAFSAKTGVGKDELWNQIRSVASKAQAS